MAIVFQRSALDLVSQAVALTAVFASLAFIANQALLESITLGSMVMYFGAVQQGQSFLSSFLTNLARLYESNLFLTNLHEFLQLEPKVREPATPKRVPRPRMPTSKAISRISSRFFPRKSHMAYP